MKYLNLILILFSIFGCKKEIDNSNNSLFKKWSIDIVNNKYESTYQKSVVGIDENFSALTPIKINKYDADEKITLSNDTNKIKPCFNFTKKFIWELNTNNNIKIKNPPFNESIGNQLIIKNLIGEKIGEYYIELRNTDFYGEDAKNTFFLYESNAKINLGFGGRYSNYIWHFSINGNKLTITPPKATYDLIICDSLWNKALTLQNEIVFSAVK